MASRSVARDFTGLACPQSMDFGYHHGTNPTLCTLRFPGNVPAALGIPFWVLVDHALWAGFVVGQEYDTTAQVTTIEAVDWRDRLHDVHVFAAFNMQEADGRFYHILPSLTDEEGEVVSDDWESQLRTYVARELKQEDFFVFQDLPPDTIIESAIASQTLYSVYTLLSYLAITHGFTIHADEFLTKILQNTYPPNIDWNGGARVIDAVQQLCDKCNAQFTCIGTNLMVLSLRGFTDNPFLQALLNGLITTCDLGADHASLGLQLHDRGRRVRLQGDRNRYEAVYCCHPNWNPAWTFDLAYDGASLAALLDAHDLTLASKIKELPPAFHDYETWVGNPELIGKGERALRRTRMEMRIEEYLDQIVYKAYIVDFSAQCIDFVSDKDAVFRGSWRSVDRETLTAFPGVRPLEAYPRFVGFDAEHYGSFWPLAKNLVSETNTQSVIYATSNAVIEGAEAPFYHQLTFIPKNGLSLDTEEVIDTDGRVKYRVRIFFGEPQAFMNPEAIDAFDPNAYTPDLPLVLIALEKDIYHYEQGAEEGSLRSREQRINVPNLSRGFIHDFETGEYKEVSILTRNFAKNLEDGGAIPAVTPVRADDIAESIASQLLFRKAVHQSGALTFYERAGTMPDGVIDSVKVTWGSGSKAIITEQVNFGTPLDNTRDILPPQLARLSFRFLDETELNRRRTEWAYRLAMDEMRRRTKEVKPDPGDAVFKAGIRHPAMSLKMSGRHGVAKIHIHSEDYPGGLMGQDAIKAGEIVFG